MVPFSSSIKSNHQPVTSPRQDSQNYLPPSLRWRPPTPTWATKEEEVALSPFSLAILPENPSYFEVLPYTFSSSGLSSLRQPFSSGYLHSYQPHNCNASSQIQQTPSLSQQLSPFTGFPGCSPSFTLNQPSPKPSGFSLPPSNACLSPSPCGGSFLVRKNPKTCMKESKSIIILENGSLMGGRIAIKSYSFLKLPPEVRAAIYQELVPEAELHVTMSKLEYGTIKMFSYQCKNGRPICGDNDAAYIGRYWFAMTEREYRRLGSTPRTPGHLTCVQIGPRMKGFGQDQRGWVSLLMSCKSMYVLFIFALSVQLKRHFADRLKRTQTR